MVVEREPLERRHVVADGGGARGVHPHLPRHVPHVRAEQRDEHAPRRTLRQRDERVRLAPPVVRRRRPRFDRQPVGDVHIVAALIAERIQRCEDDREALVLQRVQEPLAAGRGRLPPRPGANGLDTHHQRGIGQQAS